MGPLQLAIYAGLESPVLLDIVTPAVSSCQRVLLEENHRGLLHVEGLVHQGKNILVMDVSIFCLLYVGSSEGVVDAVEAESFLNHESFARPRGTKDEEHIFVAILQALLEIKVVLL